MTKYEKFTEDLKEAVEEAKKFSNIEDGGTCNFDSATISLVGWQEKKLEAAIEAAGCFSSKWNECNELIICGGTSGQGNRRTTMAETIYNYLKACGYNTGMYYQMD